MHVKCYMHHTCNILNNNILIVTMHASEKMLLNIHLQFAAILHHVFHGVAKMLPIS